MKSLWEEVELKKIGSKLSKDINCDIVVVGGGIAGILTAYRLKEAGKKVTIIEATDLFSGVTKNTTAHITANQGYVYLNLPFKKAKDYYLSQQQAIADYECIIKENNIECNFEKADDYIFTLKKPKKLKKLYTVLSKIDTNIKYKKSGKLLNTTTKGFIIIPEQASFHPFKFFNGLNLDGIDIFINTRITNIDLDNKTLFTSEHQITANKIIIATNYPIVNIRGGFFLKLYKSHSYVVSVLKDNPSPFLYQTDVENGLTFRRCEDKIIVGGLDHRTGRIDKKGKFERLQEIANQMVDSNKVTNYWSTNDCITFDGMPLAGVFSKNHKDIYVITGFNKWGMANSMVCSSLVTNLVLNKEHSYQKLFNPQRLNISLLSLIKNLGITLKYRLLLPAIPSFKSINSLKKGEGDIVNSNGKTAAFKDYSDKSFENTPYCGHMGCQLKFNPNTLTWDCPCHGSTYSKDGEIISAPTVKNIKNKRK